MSLNKNLPAPKSFAAPENICFDAPSEALDRFVKMPQAAESDEPNTISIYDQIGDDGYGGGFGVKRMAAALRSIGSAPVTVNLNSPGGSMFDGLAMYNLLREHPAEVKVKVMGMAASAASIIAMAGDSIEMGAGSFLMIHNAWGLVVGDTRDFASASTAFGAFDAAMAEIYAARTGLPESDVAAMMNAETWLNSTDAVEQGFADGKFDAPAGAAASASKTAFAKRKLDAALAKSGMSRTERRALMHEMTTGTQDAADPPAMQDAGTDIVAALSRLVTTIQN